eukprot:SAG31_NODE_25666_length_457_cov_0.578212_1_plen_140_part_10
MLACDTAAMEVLNGMSGTGLTFAAHNGTMGLRFDSDGGSATAEFQAQLWCAPLVLGCTDSSATNFDKAANGDDGSCSYDESRLVLAGIRVDPTARAAWDRLDGWSEASNLSTWTGIVLGPDGRVTGINFNTKAPEYTALD